VGQMLTCRRCFQRFSSAANSSSACSFHPAMYTGGEVAKVSARAHFHGGTTQSAVGCWWEIP
jgi:hypothetical protein